MLGAACSSSHHPSGPAAPATTLGTGIAAPATSDTGTAAPTTSVTGTAAQCPMTPAPAAGRASPPAGLVSLTIYQGGRVPFPDQVFTDPAVSGVDLLIGWNKLEPEHGIFNWSILDCLFQQADTHQKFVVLTLMPGFASPPWVLQLPGVQTQSFSYAYFSQAPARLLPLPWSQPYLEAWFAFLQAVGARYGANPAFRLIEVAGPTSVSTEMSLPDRTSGDTALPPSTHGSDVAEWTALGYTPTRYTDAWREAFAAYHRIFPDQYLGVSLYPGLPIGDDGQPDPSQANKIRLDVIGVGMQYRGQFDLQEDGIKGGVPPPTDPGYNEVMANCGTVVTGLQNSRASTVTSAQGPPSLALVRVVAAGVKFWEVYTADVLNPAYQDVMHLASTELPADAGCRPLVLTTAVRPGGAVVVTARTALRLDPSEAINIFGDAALLRTCATNPCSVTGAGGSFTADVGAPGTAPYTTQAVVSAGEEQQAR